MPAKPKKQAMSNEHKEKLAEGRKQWAAVDRYLKAVEEQRPKRGRKRTPDSVKKQLATVEDKLKNTSGATRLKLLQTRRNLEVELAGMQVAEPDLGDLEKEFVKAAKAYSENQHISYGAFREFGVAPEVLKKAGITRGS